MKIVIDITDEEYKTLSKLSEKEKVNELSYYERIIADGTPLPKGHGDLIDRDYFIDKYAGCGDVYCEDTSEDTSCEECNSRVVSKFNIDSAPTVIPAER